MLIRNVEIRAYLRPLVLEVAFLTNLQVLGVHIKIGDVLLSMPARGRCLGQRYRESWRYSLKEAMGFLILNPTKT